MNSLPIQRYIDHAVLKPELSTAEAAKAIQLGVDYNVRTVCVRPCDIELAVEICKGSETEVSTVVAFPHGTVPGAIKAEEARLYITKGAVEIDMVANYGRIQSGDWAYVEEDIRLVADVTKKKGALLKVILETGLLTTDQISHATKIAIAAGADFVKTSTGFYGGGASEEAVAAMLEAATGKIAVKASGGIKDASSARRFIEMGCQRLGIGYSTVPAICNNRMAPSDTPDTY